jgi:hypothetical protein
VIPSSKLGSYLFITATLTCFSHNAYSACSRDDVEFYLNKGFSTDQITKLCDTTHTSQHNTKNTAPATLIGSNSTASNNTELFLREAIKGRNISLTNDFLNYTSRICIIYDEEDNYGFAPKACLNVKFKVALKDLEVKQPGKKYLFFNPDEIEIKGLIAREVINGLEKYKTKDRKLILKMLESGSKTTIPVRDDISLEKFFEVLKQIAI